MRYTNSPALLLALGALAIASPGWAQQSQPRPATVAPTPEARAGQAAPPAEATPAPGTSWSQNRRALPQGFSVVLVLGDIQGATTADDVPMAARKALVDMRDFLPFKSYKLLDAAWLMCCGQDPRPGAMARGLTGTGSSPNAVSQLLRGPDEQEYELKLVTSRAESSQVFVKFTLYGRQTSGDAADATSISRTTSRRIADLRDQRGLLQKQIEDARKKVEVGIAPGGDVAKLELELRRLEREIEDLSTRLAETRVRSSARGVSDHEARSTVIDTSFAMNIGETVVVGTSRLKGGSKALIALLTAVPPRATERRE